jgi:hypothetical protein
MLPSATVIQPEEELNIEAYKVGRRQAIESSNAIREISKSFARSPIKALRDMQWLVGRAQKVRGDEVAWS